MDYEKKYKEAQKWIESIYSELSYEQQMEAEAFFPELKESEDVDKKIREEIIATIHLYYGEPLEDEAKEMIAWLEKQGKEDSSIQQAYKQGYTEGQRIERKYWHEKQEGCEYIRKDWLEHIKQSWYKEGFIDGKYSGGTSKEWTINDAATLKELIDFLENGTAKLQHDLTKYANWLKIQFTPIEKQGEKDKIESLRTEYEKGRADVLRCIDPDEMVADFCSQPLSKTRSIASVYRQGITDILKRINSNEENSITGTCSIDNCGL